MENLNELEVEEVPEIVETIDEEGTDTTDWKAEALKNQGIAKRYKTKIEKIKEAKDKEAKAAAEPKAPEKKEGFDYAQLAYLASKGVTEEEIPFVEETLKSTGKELKDLLGTKWFQAELKERRELEATKNAIPEGTKRSAGTSRDQVDYWLAKGELPPADQVELRRQVVNARIKAEEKSKFTPNPVV